MPRVAAKPKATAVRYKRGPAKVAAPRRVAAKPAAKAAAKPQRSTPLGASIGTALGTALGAAIGGPGGGAIGGMIGNAGGGLLSKIFGHGDYSVSNLPAIKENSLALANAANIPQFGTGKVAVNFKHREYLGDVISSPTVGAFQIQAFPLNPGLATTFPWLSGVVGANFQQYRINGMTFEFRSMSADALNSTNTALGSVVMSTDYDSADAPFNSKQQMENTEYGVSCKPSANMLHAIECARSQTAVSELYVRAYGNPAGTDVRLYDLGRFYIATVGMQAASVNLGELWATYDVDAFKAIEQPPLYQAPIAAYTLVSPDSTHPLGTSQSSLYDPSNPSGGSFPDQIGLTFTGGSVQLPSSIPINSVWNLMYFVTGTSIASVPPASLTYAHGLSLVGNVVSVPVTTATATLQQYNALFKYTGGATPGAPPSISWANGVLPTAATGGLEIYQVSPAMATNYLI